MGKGRMGMVAACAATAAALFAAGEASADTRHAAPGADGPDPCVKADPCEIRDATSGATSPDEVRLAPGNYEIGSSALLIPGGVSFGGKKGKAERPVIAGGGLYGLQTIGGTIHDVEVEPSGYGVFVFGGAMERSIVRTTEIGAVACAPFTSTIRDSICQTSGMGADAIYSVAGCGTPIVYPPVELVNVTAIASGSASRAIYVLAEESCTLAVEGVNVIAQGQAVDLLAEADNEPDSSASIALDYSAFDSATAVDPNELVTAPGSASNITSAPVFADTALHQELDSPTRNAGTATPSLGSITPDDLGMVDIDGEDRNQQGAVDIGADEYGPAGEAKIKKPKGSTVVTSERKAQVKFKFKAENAKEFECKVDKKPWKPCKSGEEIALKAGRGDGKRHSVKARGLNSIEETGKKDVWRGRVRRS